MKLTRLFNLDLGEEVFDRNTWGDPVVKKFEDVATGQRSIVYDFAKCDRLSMTFQFIRAVDPAYLRLVPLIPWDLGKIPTPEPTIGIGDMFIRSRLHEGTEIMSTVFQVVGIDPSEQVVVVDRVPPSLD